MVNTAPDSFNSQSHASRFYLLVDTVFTCDDGTDSFYVQTHVFFTFPDGVVNNTGPSLLLGGTGAFVGLQGNGVDTDGVLSGYISQL